MLHKGMVVKSDLGRKMKIDQLIGNGSEGLVYTARDLATGENGVVKIFHSKFDKAKTAERIRFLMNQKLEEACPALVPPVDSIIRSDIVGHFSPFISGENLEELLVKPRFTFIDGLCIGAGIAQLVSVLHQRGIAYGDIHADNFIIRQTNGVFEVYAIDLDNFYADRMPPPPMVGHSLYIPPELRTALAQNKPVVPTITSDLYEVGVLLHELILLCHPAAGWDRNEAEFNRAMSGTWTHDPTLPNYHKASDGHYPVGVLNNELNRLFRKSLSNDPNERPTAEAWKAALTRAINNVYICPECNCPSIIDSSKTACPLHNHHYPSLKFAVAATGKTISLDRGTIVVGRKELGGSPMVSARHVVCRKVGPETQIESFGRNGTYRWSGSKWVKLPDNKPVVIQANDRLRMADVEVRVIA